MVSNKRSWKSKMDNPTTQSTFSTRHRMKTNKTRKTKQLSNMDLTKKMAWVWIHVLATGKQFLFLQISSPVLKWQLWLYLGLIIVQLHINCFASTSYACVGFFTWQEIKQFKFHANMRCCQPRYIIASDIWFVRGFYVLIY